MEHIYGCISKENHAVTIITEDFNARPPLFWEHDIENNEGRVFNNFSISNNLGVLINEHTHIRANGSQSCIDLICTDQPYICTETGVLQSLDPHSKHKIVHGTRNVQSPCPPPYKRKVWDYKTSKTDSLRKELSNINWQSSFFNLSFNEMSLVFTGTFLCILSQHF